MIPLAGDLTAIWALLIGFAVFAYVVLDGFDLGIGMLFALFPAKRDRDVLMNTVAPVWDGNETWLVLGGGGLFAAFPLAYALILPALYIPITAMLLALVFRGVAFEYRWRAVPSRRWFWDLAFIAGSGVATFMQGAALGALLQGIEVDEAARVFSGGRSDWWTPFSALTGVAVMAGYALLGAAWLVLKTEGALQERARRIARRCAWATLGFVAMVSLATPFLQSGYYIRWISGWGILAAVVFGVAILVIAGLLWRSLRAPGRDLAPFLLAQAFFGVCFVGLGVCMWPYVLPTEITIWEAAAPRSAQVFMLIGAGVLIPVILAYTGYAYWVFRGKVGPETGYH